MGVYATYDADTDTENMVFVDAAVVDELLDVVANLIEALLAVAQLECVVHNFVYDVVLQVGNDESHTVTADADISQPVWITKATPGTICKRMVVDGVEVPPASKYQFTETGSHVVKFAFNPFINSGNLLAKYHIPEVGFKDVADIVAISIPEGYTLFRNQVFSGCEKLTSVSLPSTLKSVGYSTFAYCDSLSEIDFPDNILRFPDHQFNKCKNLKRVKLPANLENLGSYTFQSCSSLQEVDIPESVKITLTHTRRSRRSHVQARESITM